MFTIILEISLLLNLQKNQMLKERYIYIQAQIPGTKLQEHRFLRQETFHAPSKYPNPNSLESKTLC